MRNLSRTKVLITIIIILFLANLAMLAYFVGKDEPQKKFDRGERGPNAVNTVLQEKVGFSEAQMARVNELRKKHWENMRMLFDENRKAKIEFYTNLSKTEINDSLLDAAAARIGSSHKAIDLQTFRNFRDVRALCTPEQLPKYDSLVPATIQKMWFPSRKDHQGKKDDRRESS